MTWFDITPLILTGYQNVPFVYPQEFSSNKLQWLCHNYCRSILCRYQSMNVVLIILLVNHVSIHLIQIKTLCQVYEFHFWNKSDENLKSDL